MLAQVREFASGGAGTRTQAAIFMSPPPVFPLHLSQCPPLRQGFFISRALQSPPEKATLQFVWGAGGRVGAGGDLSRFIIVPSIITLFWLNLIRIIHHTEGRSHLLEMSQSDPHTIQHADAAAWSGLITHHSRFIVVFSLKKNIFARLNSFNFISKPCSLFFNYINGIPQT